MSVLVGENDKCVYYLLHRYCFVLTNRATEFVSGMVHPVVIILALCSFSIIYGIITRTKNVCTIRYTYVQYNWYYYPCLSSKGRVAICLLHNSATLNCARPCTLFCGSKSVVVLYCSKLYSSIF